MRRVVLAILLAGMTLGVPAAGCGSTRDLPPCVAVEPDGGRSISTGGDPVLLAAGDIIVADNRNAEATARLLDRYDGVVATLGDNVNIAGALDDFLDLYEPTWGRHRWRTHPAVGNHDYLTQHAAPYFAYFCTAAGTPFEGWYSYDLGRWHVVVLNSECVDSLDPGLGCGDGSAQITWLERDLAAHPSACTLAYWHHPQFSSDDDGDHPKVRAFWQRLYDARADLVLNGHDHHYERYAPMTPEGVADPERGIRQIIVGTGGAVLVQPVRVHANSERQVMGVYGIIRVELHASSYDWAFIDVDGTTRDSGSGTCHRGS